MNESAKSRFEVVVTSYGRNKNHDDEINKKNQEKANNSLSYRFAAIKKDTHVYNNCYELRSRAINHNKRSHLRYDAGVEIQHRPQDLSGHDETAGVRINLDITSQDPI